MDWTALRISLWLGVGTIVILLPLGVWFGRLLAIHDFRGKLVVESLVTVPLVLPPTVLGFYLLVAFGVRSPIGHAFQSLLGHPLPKRRMIDLRNQRVRAPVGKRRLLDQRVRDQSADSVSGGGKLRRLRNRITEDEPGTNRIPQSALP